MDPQVVVDRLATAEPVLVVCDYDGTLSGIVADPEAAVPIAGAIEALSALRDRGVGVAIVSGRPVEFLLRHVTVPGVALVGQYGLERAVDGRAVADPRAAPYADAVRAAADELDAAFADLYIERKGTIAVTAHWRAMGELESARLDAIDDIARRHGLVIHPTRKARELRPPLPVDKGSAISSLLFEAPVGGALFAGDDRGDLAAFDALDDARESGRVATSIKVGVLSAEAPPELVEAADLLVDGPPGVVALLEHLTRARAASGSSRPV